MCPPEALAAVAFEGNCLRRAVTSDMKGVTGLDGREHTDASAGDPVGLSDLKSDVFLAGFAVVEVSNLAGFADGGRERLLFDQLRDLDLATGRESFWRSGSKLIEESVTHL